DELDRRSRGLTGVEELPPGVGPARDVSDAVRREQRLVLLETVGLQIPPEPGEEAAGAVGGVSGGEVEDRERGGGVADGDPEVAVGHRLAAPHRVPTPPVIRPDNPGG